MFHQLTKLRSFIILALVCSLFGCKKSKTSIPGHNDDATVALVTGLNGITEPCGCTSKPLGGLDRMATLIQSQTNEAPTWLVVTGNTLFSEVEIEPEMLAQARLKALTIAKVLKTLEPVAMVLGENDEARSMLEDLYPDYNALKLPIFTVPKIGQPSERVVDGTIHSYQGFKVGFMGMSHYKSGSLVSPDYFSRAAIGLRAQGARLVIALLPFVSDEAEKFSGGFRGIDIVVAGGQEEVVSGPKTLKNGVILVDAGSDGKYVGFVRLKHLQKEGPMTYFDEGKAKSKSLAARIKHLKDALTELSPGPGADARKAKLLKLEKEYDDFRVTEPQGPYFTWELSRVEQSLRSDTKSEVLLNKFNRSLCDVRNRLEKDLDCGRAVPIQDNFLGNQACIACHGAAFKVWQGTEHAQAWATLENKGKECDVGCVACHSVGFQKPGGFCRLMDKAPFVNVGCENCHGPGAGHAENPGDRTLWSKRFVAKPTADVCRECHNQTHSDEFNFDTYLPRILGPGHGAQP